MTETHTPLPCPFCEGDAIMIHEDRVWIECADCPSKAGVGPFNTRAEALTAWNTRAVNSHHDLIEALRPFAFVGQDDPKDTQAVWEMIYRDRVQDWFSYEDFERARAILTKAEAGR